MEKLNEIDEFRKTIKHSKDCVNQINTQTSYCSCGAYDKETFGKQEGCTCQMPYFVNNLYNSGHDPKCKYASRDALRYR